MDPCSAGHVAALLGWQVPKDSLSEAVRCVEYSDQALQHFLVELAAGSWAVGEKAALYKVLEIRVLLK